MGHEWGQKAGSAVVFARVAGMIPRANRSFATEQADDLLYLNAAMGRFGVSERAETRAGETSGGAAIKTREPAVMEFLEGNGA